VRHVQKARGQARRATMVESSSLTIPSTRHQQTKMREVQKMRWRQSAATIVGCSEQKARQIEKRGMARRQVRANVRSCNGARIRCDNTSVPTHSRLDSQAWRELQPAPEQTMTGEGGGTVSKRGLEQTLRLLRYCSFNANFITIPARPGAPEVDGRPREKGMLT
jgi:hypothetical protein